MDLMQTVQPNTKRSEVTVSAVDEKMNLKNTAIGLNVLLVFLCVGFFIGHGSPQTVMLWTSEILLSSRTTGKPAIHSDLVLTMNFCQN